MDSGNSSSMQSSSCGGDEEYDSRADHPPRADQSISAFLNTTPSSHHHHRHHRQGGAPMPSPIPPLPPPSQPPPPSPHHHHHQTQFDSLVSNHFNSFPLSINLDNMAVWPKTVRPESGRPDLAGFAATSSPRPPSSSQQIFLPTQPKQQVNANSTSSQSGSELRRESSLTNNSDNMVRNPKKRSRASRRAPTTVLNTDTTNFRAMVQEFTGIPAPPFTGSSPLKPLAKRLIPSSFLSSSSSVSSASSATIASSSSSMNFLGFELPSADHQNHLNTNAQNIGNPFLNFQFPTNPFADSSVFGLKSKTLFDSNQPIEQQTQNMKTSTTVLDDFDRVRTNLGGLQNIVSSSSSLQIRNENFDDDNGGVDFLRSINGGRHSGSLRGMSFRAAAAAASGSFSGPENNVAAARSEGMVESWICSSD